VSSSKSSFSSEGPGPGAGSWAVTDNTSGKKLYFLLKNNSLERFSLKRSNCFATLRYTIGLKKTQATFLSNQK